MPNVKEHFVGIDVAKACLDVAVLGEKDMMQIANTKTDIMQLSGADHCHPERRKETLAWRNRSSSFSTSRKPGKSSVRSGASPHEL